VAGDFETYKVLQTVMQENLAGAGGGRPLQGTQGGCGRRLHPAVAPHACAFLEHTMSVCAIVSGLRSHGHRLHPSLAPHACAIFQRSSKSITVLEWSGVVSVYCGMWLRPGRGCGSSLAQVRPLGAGAFAQVDLCRLDDAKTGKEVRPKPCQTLYCYIDSSGPLPPGHHKDWWRQQGGAS